VAHRVVAARVFHALGMNRPSSLMIRLNQKRPVSRRRTLLLVPGVMGLAAVETLLFLSGLEGRTLRCE
jgi:hypothetical protein